MKLKVYQLINAKPILEMLNKQSFSAKIAFIIQRNIKKINEELQSFDELKNTILTKHGAQTTENGIQISKENRDDFVKEFNELLDTEIDVSLTLIPLEEFNFTLSPESMSVIAWMFSFEE